MLAFPPDFTFVVQLASFFVLLVLLHRLLFAPFSQVLEERSRRTDGTREQAARERAEAGQISERVDKELAAARARALAGADGIRRQAREREVELLARAKAEADARLAELRSGIEREREAAAKVLRDDAKRLAEEMVVAVLGNGGGRP